MVQMAPDTVQEDDPTYLKLVSLMDKTPRVDFLPGDTPHEPASISFRKKVMLVWVKGKPLSVVSGTLGRRPIRHGNRKRVSCTLFGGTMRIGLCQSRSLKLHMMTRSSGQRWCR